MPWVAQSVLDGLRQDAAAARLEARRERDIADTRYDDLLAKYHALKAAGATPLTLTSTAELALAAPPRDELKELIGEVCGQDYAKRKVMLRQLAVDRAAKVSDDRIRDAILQGVQGEGVPA